jgi:hypothetical protein
LCWLPLGDAHLERRQVRLSHVLRRNVGIEIVPTEAVSAFQRIGDEVLARGSHGEVLGVIPLETLEDVGRIGAWAGDRGQDWRRGTWVRTGEGAPAERLGGIPFRKGSSDTDSWNLRRGISDVRSCLVTT